MKKIKLLIKFLVMVLIVVVLYNYFDKKINTTVVEVEVVHQITEYGYSLNDNETNYYNLLFDQLKVELDKEEIDESNYATLVAKLFVTDFYNLDNKLTNNDIGGIQFIRESYQDTLVLIAKDTIYKYVENNLDGKRNQELPIVENVVLNGAYNKNYEYGDATDENAYEIDLTIEYKSDLGYQSDIKVILIHEDEKLVIAELN